MSIAISEFIPSTPDALVNVSVFAASLTLSVLEMRWKSTCLILYSCVSERLSGHRSQVACLQVNRIENGICFCMSEKEYL